MASLDELFGDLLLERESPLNQPSSSSSKRKRKEVNGKIKTKITKQFFNDATGNSQEKSSKASCSVTWKERRLVVPNDVIPEILSRLPAKFLWKVGRYVCKDWFKLIREPSFANSCLLLPSLLIQQFKRQESKTVWLNINSLSSSEFELTQMESRFPVSVRSNSDGVLLIENTASLYVANPLTKQVVKIPSPTKEQDINLNLRCSYIARVPSTGKFKVLCLSEKVLNGFVSTSCCLLTIESSMKWTEVFNVSPTWSELMSLGTCSKSISGVIYIYGHESLLQNQILAIDLRTDELRTHTLKIPIKGEFGLSNRVISCGSDSLGFVDLIDKEIRLWRLKDLYNSKWEIIKSFRVFYSLFDRGLSNCDDFHMWLDCYQMLIISRMCVSELGTRVKVSVLAYSIGTGEWRKVYESPFIYKYQIFIHSNSLIQI